jgi:hypothetical protein
LIERKDWEVFHGSNLNQRIYSPKWQRKSIKPDSKFKFINVAILENEDLYWKAYEKSVTPVTRKLTELGVEQTPALYNVAFEY